MSQKCSRPSPGVIPPIHCQKQTERSSNRVKALILAPFHTQLLDRLRARIEIIYESWTDTRRLLSPEELIERIQSEDIAILVVEADFVFEEVFEESKGLRF